MLISFFSLSHSSQCNMAVLIQIILTILALYSLNSAKASPIFGEFTWKKNVDVGFKPIPFKPIAFIKEAWSPFGIFGVKRGIVKREIKPEPKVPIPDFGQLLKSLSFKPLTFIKEKWTPFGIFGEKHGFVKRDLDQIVPPEKPIAPVPVSVSEISQLSRLPAAVYEEPEKVPLVPKLGPVEMPPLPAVVPVPAPAPPMVVITPRPIEKEPFEGLNTNIGRDEDIGNYLSAVNEVAPIGNSIIPEKPKAGTVPLDKQENLIVRGSKLAFDLGSLLLEIFSQFLGRGKFP